MREKYTERRLVRRVKECGGLCPKFVSPGTDGVPDRLVLLPGGRLAFAEVKAEGEKLRPLQVKRKRQLEELGFRVYVVDAPEKIDAVIAEITEDEGGDAG